MKPKLNLTTDAKRFAWMRKHLYVPAVCDVLDSLGCRDRAMHQRLRPLDSMGRGRVMAYDVPVRCGEVLVQPGELVFADFDGVVVVPRALEDDALARAHEKVTKENHSRRDLLRGDTLRAVFGRHGVL